jgi:hypothetical protein
MLKLKNTAMFLVAALCGYLALMTPDWKAELIASSGPGYQSNVDADGDDDLIQVNGADNVKVYEIENSASVGASIAANVPNFVTTGDFDGDADTDYLGWDGVGSLVITEMQGGAAVTTHDLGTFNSAYEIVGTGDFDGDNDDDIAFYRNSDGRVVTFQIENNAKVAQNWMGDFLQTAYRPIGLGDVDADGDDDFYFVRYTGADNNLVVVWWFQNGTRNDKLNDGAWLQSYYNNAYKVRAIADTDGDGDDDTVWRSTADGNTVVWQTGYDAVKARPAVELNQWAGQFGNTAYDIVESGDTNADGIEDLIWYNSSNGGTNVWEMSGNAMSQSKSILATSNTAFAPVEKDFTRKYD